MLEELVKEILRKWGTEPLLKAQINIHRESQVKADQELARDLQKALDAWKKNR